MYNKNSISNQFKRTSSFLGGVSLIILILCSCAQQKPQMSVSQFRFDFNNETYRIRSISSGDKTESYNELIGKKFLAADYDQDRIIDCILLGEVSLGEAQLIYDYGLNEVSKEKKLQVRNPSINRYVHDKNDFQLEIRSFRPTNAQPFNEFKITDNRPLVRPAITIIVDQNADGSLDEVLKGTVAIEDIQSLYTEAIAAGLQKGELVKANGMILVKER